LGRAGRHRQARREGRSERMDLHAERAGAGRRRAPAADRHRDTLVRSRCAQGAGGVERSRRSFHGVGRGARFLPAPTMKAAHVEVFPGGLMRALRPVILIPALLVAGWPSPALSDVEPVGPEIPVNTFLPGNQQLPAVATDASGGFVVVWQSGSSYGATPAPPSSPAFR